MAKVGRPPTGVDRPVGYFRETAEFWAEVDKIAEAEGKSRSAVLSEAVRRYIDWWHYEHSRSDGGRST